MIGKAGKHIFDRGTEFDTTPKLLADSLLFYLGFYHSPPLPLCLLQCFWGLKQNFPKPIVVRFLVVGQVNCKGGIISRKNIAEGMAFWLCDRKGVYSFGFLG